MEAVIARQKLIDRPGAEDPLLRLVHLQVNLVPRPVMKHHDGHEGRCSLPRHQGDHRGKRNSLDGRLAHRQPYVLVFTPSDRFVAEYGSVMLVKAPLLIVLGLALLAWAYREAGGFGLMLNQPSQFSVCGPKAGGFWTFFFPPLMANVG